MRGCTNAFKAEVTQAGQIPICRVDIIRDGKVILQLPVHDGSVTADRTAAQMRNFDVSCSDPTGTLTPQGMQSVLTPFGTHIQVWRGLRLQNVTTLVALYNTQPAWTPQTTFGVMNGVVGDGSDGSLRLGP